MPQGFANTPAPPYYAVTFTSKRTSDERGYAAKVERAYAGPEGRR